MSQELRQSIQQSGQRSYEPPRPLKGDTGDLYSGAGGGTDHTFKQQPETVGRGSDGFRFEDSSALWYPDDLGSPSNAYYVKFEVYLLDTDKSTTKVRGDGAREVGFAKGGGGPRFVSGLGTNSGHLRNTSVIGSPTMKRLDQVIAMPMPDAVVTDHSTMWSKAEGGMVSAVLSLGDGVVSNGLDGAAAIGKTALLGAASGVTGLLSQLDLDGANTATKLLTKRSTNPRNEFLFDGVNNRSFNFQWDLIPKSEREARKIKDILDRFKLLMYPELDQSTAGNFYLFPAMFDITFYRGSQENEWLYRTSTCALTNMIVNYSGAGQWASAGDSGSPVAYNVTLQFTEAEFLHRDRFKSKNNPKGVAR